jgi:hypothetical protein
MVRWFPRYHRPPWKIARSVVTLYRRVIACTDILGPVMKIAAFIAALLLAGCAEPKYMWSKPGTSTFAQDSGGCKEDINALLKASPTVYFLKDGNHYQGSGEWAQRTYNECMRALGYTPSREMTASEISSTPSVIANKAAASDKTSDAFTLAKGVLSGTSQKIDFMYSVNPDCSSAGYPTVHVIKPPAHGTMAADQGDGYSSFGKDNQRYECNRAKSPGILVHYRSDAGFTGADSAAVETIFPSGNVRSTTYNISVK